MMGVYELWRVARVDLARLKDRRKEGDNDVMS